MALHFGQTFREKKHDEFHWLSGVFADDLIFYVADYLNSLPDISP
jgi:hypothetical protein